MSGKYSRGSKWRKWDLHVHTSSGTPNEIVESLIENEISVFSITDHSCVDRVDEFLELSKKKQEKGKEIYFLPGVELKTDKGNKSVHLIGIFPLVDKDNNLINSSYLRQNLLSKINCTEKEIINAGREVVKEGTDENKCKERGRLEITVNFEEAAKQIRQIGGITIVHAGTKSSGIEKEMKHSRNDTCYEILNSLGHTKRDLMKNYIDVCELPNWHKNNIEERDFYLKQFNKPSIVSSDSHKMPQIGSKYTWIKADPTFEGLKQIIYEPKIRVKIQERKPEYFHPQIVSMKLLGTDDYQNKEDKEKFPPISLCGEIFFSPNLNCIIGARASGKTVLVEMIGYSIDIFSKEKRDDKTPLVEFISNKFENTGVKITYTEGDNEFKIFERDIIDNRDPFYNSPIKVEYWTQGEIEKKANIPSKLSEYIWERLKSDELEKTEDEISDIKEEMRKIRTEYSEKLKFEVEKKKLETERRQIESYFKTMRTPEYKLIVSNIKKNRKKRQLLESIIEDIIKIMEILKETEEQIEYSITFSREEVKSLFETDDAGILSNFEDYYSFQDKKLKEISENLENIISEIEDSRTKKKLQKEKEKLEAEFEDYCERNGVEINKEEYDKRNNRIKFINRKLIEVGKQLERFKTLRKKHNELEEKLKKRLRYWVTENKKRIKEFNKSFRNTSIKAVWEDPYVRIRDWLREQFCESNDDLKEYVAEYYGKKLPLREDYLDDIIGSFCELYKKENIISEIKVSLKNEEIPDLSEEANRKKDTLDWFFKNKQTHIIREDLIMRLGEYSEQGINYISYANKILGRDSMSFGERCGALVELILLSDNHPLIIDQPEDHLDAKFVAERVVDIIRKQKLRRQIIICTHNANIVALGDCEFITSLEVDEEFNVIANQFTIENLDKRHKIFNTLEGGEAAFNRRERKYGFI